MLWVWVVLAPGWAGAETKGPTYAELGDGTSAIWIEYGVMGWLTERAPLADLAPLSVGVGFSHRIGPARLGWRVHLFTGAIDDAPRFLYADLLSVERVYGAGGLRPWWRVALGFGLDLRGPISSLGADGYFNSDNGAAGGIGLTHGWGLDWDFSDRLFMRGEANIRAYGGAGRTGVAWAGLLGVGCRL